MNIIKLALILALAVAFVSAQSQCPANRAGDNNALPSKRYPQCSGHGICNQEQVCTCDAGFAGTDCEIDCNNHGATADAPTTDAPSIIVGASFYTLKEVRVFLNQISTPTPTPTFTDCATSSITTSSITDSSTTQIINKFAGVPGSQNYGGDGGQATAALFGNPSGISVDTVNNLVYIADSYNCRVRVVNRATGIVTTFAGNGTAGYSGDYGQATAALLNYPVAVSVDPTRNLVYIADNVNVIRVVNRVTGIITTFAGNGVRGFSGDGGLATDAKIDSVVGVGFDPVRNLVYFSAIGNSRVRVVNCVTGIITTFAGNGGFGYSGDGGPAVSAQLDYPWGVSVDPTRNLVYIAEQVNARIRVVNGATGIITTFAGNGTLGYSGDYGQATAAQLFAPVGVSVDPTRNLVYIADYSRVRVVNGATGIITTFAGNGTLGYSGDGDKATGALLNFAYAVSVDPLNNLLYIADLQNQIIRVVSSPNSTNGPTSTPTLSPNGTLTPKPAINSVAINRSDPVIQFMLAVVLFLFVLD